MRTSTAGAVIALSLVACIRHPVATPIPVPVPVPPAPTITWIRVASPADVPSTPPAPREWRVHLIDVGTGLAILIQGHDFTMLYDAGTNDRTETPMRVLDYLAATLGPSGDDLCVDRGAPLPTARHRIDHVVLSHPHLDHASALDLVLHCYDVANLWDSGRINETVFYRDLLTAIARAAGLAYHTALPDPRTIEIKGIAVAVPASRSFSEGDVVELGAGARFTLLHAEPKAVRDINDNSIVVAVDLGATRVLLTGDAGSGERADPAEPAGAVEAYLIDHADLDADILQVGHHGSKTSSRRAFLEAVSPSLALISTGPKAYSGTTLPDPEVIAALLAAGATVLRTDEHDAACMDTVRIGPPTGPGGCDTYVITVQE
jgi:competence protein ComEC